MTARIAILTVSDRAAAGVYEDLSGPAAEAWLRHVVVSDMDILRRITPDGRGAVAAALVDLADNWGADLILATGGTGPSPRDQTPEALAEVAPMVLDGLARRCGAPIPPWSPRQFCRAKGRRCGGGH